MDPAAFCYLMATYSVIVGEVQYLSLYQVWLKYIFFFMGMYCISSLNINSRRNFCFVFFFINMCVCLHHDDGYMYVSFMCVYIYVCVYICIYHHVYVYVLYINMCIYSLVCVFVSSKAYLANIRLTDLLC